jgi:thioredoxin reductase
VRMARANNQSGNITEVVIIGSGPYGLSIAAHLANRGVDYRIFGSAMSVWREHMPKGMRLKSEGFASSLSDPGSTFTLRHYCQQEGIRYQDVGEPVELSTFIAYGLAFQKRFVPNLEEKLVVSMDRSPAGFELELENGERVQARRVVVAVGISHFEYVPPVLASLPAELVSHSSAHNDPQKFKGQSVVIVGAGASALDLAALLNEVGAKVQVVARSAAIRFQEPPAKRSWIQEVLHPRTGIGSGLQLYFYANAPHLFRHLPEQLRLDRVRKTLGPAPPWFTKQQIEGRVPFHLGVQIVSAQVDRGQPVLHLADAQNHPSSVTSDHVVAATGYEVDLERLQFMSPSIRGSLKRTGKAPALSASFESSVPGLHFVGVSSANTFGPLMRFAFGAEYTARYIVGHLARPVRATASIYTATESPRAAEHV